MVAIIALVMMVIALPVVILALLGLYFVPVQRSVAPQSPHPVVELTAVSPQRIGDLHFPQGTPGDVELSDPGPVLTEQCIQILDLGPSELVAVNGILRTAYQDYGALEAQHTTAHRSGGQLHVTIAPFRAEAEPFLERLWRELDTALDARRRALARRHLPLGRIFGTLQFGGPKVTILITKQDNMFSYETRYEWHKGSGKTDGKSSGRATTLPPEYRRFWRKDSTDS